MELEQHGFRSPSAPSEWTAYTGSPVAFLIEPIGYVESPVTDLCAVPPQADEGAPAVALVVHATFGRKLAYPTVPASFTRRSPSPGSDVTFGS